MKSSKAWRYWQILHSFTGTFSRYRDSLSILIALNSLSTPFLPPLCSHHMNTASHRRSAHISSSDLFNGRGWKGWGASAARGQAKVCLGLRSYNSASLHFLLGWKHISPQCQKKLARCLLQPCVYKETSGLFRLFKRAYQARFTKMMNYSSKTKSANLTLEKDPNRLNNLIKVF